jgi:PEP-CTERM motif
MKRVTILALVAALSLMTASAFAQFPCGTVPSNQVKDCGFESGGFFGPPKSWTLSGNPAQNAVTNNPLYVLSGTYGAALGQVGSEATLSQTIDGNTFTFQFRNDVNYWGVDEISLIPVKSLGGGLELYHYNFYLENTSDGTTPNNFTLLWNGVDVGPTLVNAQAFPYVGIFGNVAGTTPEPGTLILLGTGILGLAGTLRRKLKF